MDSTAADARLLEVFIAVLDNGGIGAASARLGMSPSAVSQALRRLEESLGIELYQRHSRPVRLTEPGAALESTIRSALHSMTLVHAAAADLRGMLAGELTIASLPTLAVEPLAGLVAEFRHRHPGVVVSVHQPRTRTIRAVAESVRDGHADIGITEHPSGPAGLASLPLEEQHFSVVFPPGAKIRSATVGIDDLLHWGIIVGPYWEGSAVHRQLRQLDPRIDGAVSVRTEHRETFVYLATQGLGAAIVLPDRATIAAALGCQLARFDPSITRQTFVLSQPSRLSPSARAFLGICRSHAAHME
ncbi:LysR family transcriptional regulator [Rhodococcus sp. NPDC057529]|uniref:LysR family transcriptional regulator n=1 Tax=Rhodococcus sp. NPDC057529 TaxID=3346158 RepID=UPI00366D2575